MGNSSDGMTGTTAGQGQVLTGHAGFLITAAARAPSVHNTQPWRFRAGPDAVELWGDPRRKLRGDSLGREMLISCGAALFGLRLAVRSLGYRPVTELLPEPARLRLLARVSTGASAPATGLERQMLDAVPHRHTHRGPFAPGPFAPARDTWRGVPLSVVLERSGITREAVDVMPSGLDPDLVIAGVNYGRVRRPIPVAKALDDVILAYEMNGEPLPPDSEYPVRGIVPHWAGIASIKWVGQIEVSATPLASYWNTQAYPPAAWQRWEFRWRTPGPGSYTLRARATDVTGATQPTTVPGNAFGYQFDGIAGHPVITA